MIGIPGFKMPQDEHGRWFDTLAPAGGTLTIATGAVANGGYIPGNSVVLLKECVILRIYASHKTYIRFQTEGPPAADSSDMIFAAGTESLQLPIGTNYISGLSADGSAGQLSVTVLL